MNPLSILDDIVPAAYRKVVYGVLTLALLVFSIYQASEGDWSQFVGSLLTALVTGTATANTHPEDDSAKVPDDLA
jgi:hypothetical protein